MLTKEKIVAITEEAINSLMIAFQSTPYLFYAENDLHAFFYREMLNKFPIKEWQCKTKDGKCSLLLHEEYPTKERYNAKRLEENVPKGSRGHFDVCFWNPENTQKRLLRVTQSTDFQKEQQTMVAVEFDLLEHDDSLKDAVHHLKWDMLKLKSPKNEVKYGYSLVFARHWIHKDEFLKQVKSIIQEEKKVIVLFAEKTPDRAATFGTLSKKQFLNYSTYSMN